MSLWRDRRWSIPSLLIAGFLGWLMGQVIDPWWAWVPVCVLIGMVLGNVAYHLAHEKEEER